MVSDKLNIFSSLCFLVLGFGLVKSVQAQKLLQLNSYYCSTNHLAKSNLFSESGSKYFSGEFSGELIIGMNNITSYSRRAVYLGKQMSEGNVSFLKSLTCSGVISVSALALRGDSLLAVGTFSDTLFTVHDTIHNYGHKGGYMVLFDTLGNILETWHLPSFSAEIFDVNFTAEGDILLCGEFYNTMSVDGQIFNAPFGFNSFLLKLNAKGLTSDWVQVSDGLSTNARAVGSDHFGNVYITGSYGSGTLFSGQMLPEVQGDHNMFVASYNSAGILNWIKAIVSPVQVHGLSQHVLDDGTVYVGGEFEFAVDLGQTVAYSSQGLMDALVAKFDKNGVLKWSGVIGGQENDKISDLTADHQGNPILLLNGGSQVYLADSLYLEGFRSPTLLKCHKVTGEMMWNYRIPATPETGIVEGYSIDCKDSLIALCGSNRTGLYYFDEVIDSPNNDDSFMALIEDTLYRDSFVGMKENLIDGFIELFPNPAYHHLIIRSSENNPINRIEFYSSQATLLKQICLNDEYIELSDIPGAGVYHLRMVTQKGLYVRRLIIL